MCEAPFKEGAEVYPRESYSGGLSERNAGHGRAIQAFGAVDSRSGELAPAPARAVIQGLQELRGVMVSAVMIAAEH